jgi:transcriptional regulator with GAF, ATPase, and Fis domain
MASTWNSYQPEASSIWPGSLNEELGTKMERQEILLENDAGSDQRAGTGDSFQGIIGSSRTLKQTLDQVMTVAPTDLLF